MTPNNPTPIMSRLFDPFEEEYRCPNCGMVASIDDFDVIGAEWNADVPIEDHRSMPDDADIEWGKMLCPQCVTWQEVENVTFPNNPTL